MGTETVHDESPIVWLTRKAAGQRVGVTGRTIDRWADEGRLTRYRAEDMQSVRFKASEIDAMFKPQLHYRETGRNRRPCPFRRHASSRPVTDQGTGTQEVTTRA